MAESEGFEPPDLLQSTVFKTAAFDHSANSPDRYFLPFLALGEYGFSRDRGLYLTEYYPATGFSWFRGVKLVNSPDVIPSILQERPPG